MPRQKTKHAQNQLRVCEIFRLAQENHIVHHGKLRVRKPRAHRLELPVKRRALRGNLGEKLCAHSIYCARMAEINSHPVRSTKFSAAGNTDPRRSSLGLRVPRKHVVVPSMPKMKKTPHGHQEFERRLEFPSLRR